MTKIKLDNRLMSAVRFIRDGAFLADVGTDHAYLPIYLCENDKICGAVASDINEGPIERAREHIAAHSLLSKIKTVRTDGLRGIEAFEPTDIAIFGMGGELIVKILDAAEFIKNKRIRLILQPMTFTDELRRYLSENGFFIVDEALSEAEGKVYQTICAEFDGVSRRLSEAALLFGEKNIARGGELLEKIVLQKKRALYTAIEGKRKGGLDTSAEEALLREIESI